MRNSIGVCLSLVASSAFAEQTASSLTEDSARIDTTKFCVYDNELFTEGAITRQRGVYMVCTHQRDALKDSYALIWKERKKVKAE